MAFVSAQTRAQRKAQNKARNHARNGDQRMIKKRPKTTRQRPNGDPTTAEIPPSTQAQSPAMHAPRWFASGEAKYTGWGISTPLYFIKRFKRFLHILPNFYKNRRFQTAIFVRRQALQAARSHQHFSVFHVPQALRMRLFRDSNKIVIFNIPS
jgi:hypothetical protein